MAYSSITFAYYSGIPEFPDRLTSLGKDADGIIGEMPAGMPASPAPNAACKEWLDKYHARYNHDLPAGSWIAYTGVMLV